MHKPVKDDTVHSIGIFNILLLHSLSSITFLVLPSFYLTLTTNNRYKLVSLGLHIAHGTPRRLTLLLGGLSLPSSNFQFSKSKKRPYLAA